MTGPQVGKIDALSQINQVAIDYVQSNEELLAKVQELGQIEWHTVDAEHLAHLMVIRAGYTDKAVVLDIVVRDWFARELQREYVEGRIPRLDEEE